MVIEKTAGTLQVGDVMLNNGAVVTTVVPSHHGTKTYIGVRFDDGYTQTVTVAADTPVPVYVAEDGDDGHS